MASAAWRSGALPRAALILAGSAAAAIAVTTVILTVMIVKAAGIRPSSDAPVIVLGCQVKGERPSLMLTGRMDAAIRYLQDHPDVLCVVSGGKGDGEMITEAECMFRYMTARGIRPLHLHQGEPSFLPADPEGEGPAGHQGCRACDK